MKFINEPFIEGSTTVLKVRYKGAIWERRENNKLIDWSVYIEETKTFMYRCVLSTNRWHKYINDCTPVQDIEIPFVERCYLNKISIKKLYKFNLNHLYGILEGLFVSTEVKVKNIIGSTLYLGEVAGKHSNVTQVLEWDHLIDLEVSQTTIEDLLKANGEIYNICGCNPFDYLEER